MPDRATPIPAAIPAAVGLLSGLALLSALAAIPASVILPASPGWAMLGFEVVIALAAALGVLFALGRFRDAPGLAIACIAGALFVGSVLGFLGVGRTLGTLRLEPFLFARLALAGLLGALAVLSVLVRRPAAFKPAILGAVLAGAGLAASAFVYVAHTRQWHPMRPLDGLPEVLRVTGLLIAAILAVVAIAVGTHLVINAFERCRTESEAPDRDQAAPASKPA